MNDRHLLESWYGEALRACNPRTTTRSAVAALALASPPLLLAVGKAAASMAQGALDAMRVPPAAGLVVSDTGLPGHIEGIPHLRGDHPVPGAASQAAADAIAAFVAANRGTPDTIVLVSGGTTSLIAAPVTGLAPSELHATFEALLASGQPIDVMNQVRRRLLRWADGRLTAALHPSRVHCLVVSDVMSGDIAAVGSGPCLPSDGGDPIPSPLVARLPDAVRARLTAPGIRVPSPTTARIVLDNRTAVAAVRSAMRSRGIPDTMPLEKLDGEADHAGSILGRHLASLGSGGFVGGGETTVTLPPGAGRGGRCQHLALAAAREIRGLPVTLLAAGTDGRDGPTDAAGAVVDGGTWDAIIAAGRDPASDLVAHRATVALGVAGALIPARPSGTNVNDLVIGLVAAR